MQSSSIKNNNKQKENNAKNFFAHVVSCTAGGLLGTVLALFAMVAIMFANSSQDLNSADFSGSSLLIVIFVLSFFVKIK